MYARGKKSKSVSFSRVYVCVKAKLTLVSLFLTFFFMHLPLSMLITAILGFLAPLAAYTSYYFIFAILVAQVVLKIFVLVWSPHLIMITGPL